MEIRVKDIEFTSAEHVLQEIENMNVKGGSPFGRAAAHAYRLAIEQEELNSYEELLARIEDLSKKLHRLKPTMATIYNSSTIIYNYAINNHNLPLTELKNRLIILADNIIEKSYEAVDKLAKVGANLIKNNSTILMHSYSSSLMAIYSEASNRGLKFNVICTESRPLRESRNAVKVLQECGQKITYISDASVFEFMKKADLILMGADTLCTDGSVANKMGSAMIARLAKSTNTTVYFASELYKLDLRTLAGKTVELERRDKKELVSDNDFISYENLEVINQFFDLTPAGDIDGIITEYGLLHPSQLLNYWSKLLKTLQS